MDYLADATLNLLAAAVAAPSSIDERSVTTTSRCHPALCRLCGTFSITGIQLVLVVVASALFGAVTTYHILGRGRRSERLLAQKETLLSPALERIVHNAAAAAAQSHTNGALDMSSSSQPGGHLSSSSGASSLLYETVEWMAERIAFLLFGGVVSKKSSARVSSSSRHGAAELERHEKHHLHSPSLPQVPGSPTPGCCAPSDDDDDGDDNASSISSTETFSSVSSALDSPSNAGDASEEDAETDEEEKENEEGKQSLLVLVSHPNLDRTQSLHQRRALVLLESRKVAYDVVNGCDEGNRYVREELFEVSGCREISYPQFFLVGEDGALTYVGDWNRLQDINEAEELHPDVLEANPDLPTWEDVFGKLVSPDDIYQR